MPWTPLKWGTDPTVPPSLALVTPTAVVNAALLTTPEFIQGANHPPTTRETWTDTFYAFYRVLVGGWYVTLAAHCHITPRPHPGVGFTRGPGNMYIPGYGGWSQTTNMGFSGHFPTYNKTTHVHDWTNNSIAQTARFTGVARFPSQIS